MLKAMTCPLTNSDADLDDELLDGKDDFSDDMEDLEE